MSRWETHRQYSERHFAPTSDAKGKKKKNRPLPNPRNAVFKASVLLKDTQREHKIWFQKKRDNINSHISQQKHSWREKKNIK